MTIPVIDIDTHYTEPPDLWTSRAPAKFKERTFRVRRREDGTQGWYIGDEFVGKIGPQIVDLDGKKVRGLTSLPLRPWSRH